MATIIRFNGGDGAGGPMSTWVTEGADEVLTRWTAAAGQPFELTHSESGRKMFVNPVNVACWFETDAS
jgi:hypothetical protein